MFLFLFLTETICAQDKTHQQPKPFAPAISLFKDQDLVVLLYGVNASGLCAFNTVERPMAPLSHDIARVLLRQDSFGNHLSEWKNC